MKPRAWAERALRVLDELDTRLEYQTLQAGADAPHLVAMVGAFHTYAGSIERELHGPRVRVGHVVMMLRVLHRMVSTHAIMLQQRALRAKAAPKV